MKILSRIHIYLFAVIILTIIIDSLGILTSVNYSVTYTSFKNGEKNSETVGKEEEVLLDSKERNSLNIKIIPNGYAIDAYLYMTIKGNDANLKHPQKYGKLICINKKYFKLNSENICKSKIKIKSKSISEYIIFPENTNIKIKNIRIESYRAKRSSEISGNFIYYFFITLSLIGIVFHKINIKKSNTLFILISSTLLFFLSYEIFLLIISFLLVTFLIIKKILVIKKNNTNKIDFIILISLIIVSLLSVKLIIPYASSAFSNPGGLFLAIPLGFSYFIIKTIDLAVDSYKGKIENINMINYFSYMLFPATLAAGPIQTYKEFINSKNTLYSTIDFSAGFARVLLGISKKLIADTLLLPSINTNIELFTQSNGASSFENSSVVFELLLKNFIYIYLDFTAYCDMAIGSARCMGYKVPENFKWPILRTTVSQYWQNWHITLSNWARKNVFMNVMLSSRSIFLATFSTMLTIGLWHKFSLGWLSWAIHHTLIMRLENKASHSIIIKKMSLISTKIKMLRSIFMIFYVWFFVAAGQSFIIFSDFKLSLLAYYSMLTSIPLWIMSFI